MKDFHFQYQGEVEESWKECHRILRSAKGIYNLSRDSLENRLTISADPTRWSAEELGELLPLELAPQGSEEVGEAPPRHAQTSVRINPLQDPGDASAIEETLHVEEGISSARVRFEARRVEVHYDPRRMTPETVEQILVREGFRPGMSHKLVAAVLSVLATGALFGGLAVLFWWWI